MAVRRSAVFGAFLSAPPAGEVIGQTGGPRIPTVAVIASIDRQFDLAHADLNVLCHPRTACVMR